VEIAPLTLPQATGGDGALRYALSPTPPAGLDFDAETRTLSGTPTATQAAKTYTYTATDADAVDPDSASLTFTIEVGAAETADRTPTFGDAAVPDQTTPGEGTALASGLAMAMTAGGVRSDLADSMVGGFGLAFKADALWVGTGIDGVDGLEGRLAATAAAVTRYRTALETSRGYRFKQRLSIQPSLEVGLRRDGGDAETGAGMDISGGLIVSDTLGGLSAEIRMGTLLAHQDEGFRERSVSAAFSFDPTRQSPLGFLAKVTPSWGGQAARGAEALWGRDTMAGMAHGGMLGGNRLEAELGYGLAVGSRLVGTPRFGFATSEYGRDYRLGYGLTVLQVGATSFDLGVDAQRRESAGHGDAENGVLARLAARW